MAALLSVTHTHTHVRVQKAKSRRARRGPAEATALSVAHAARAALRLGLRQPDFPWIFLPHKENLFLVYTTLMYLNLSPMPFELLQQMRSRSQSRRLESLYSRPEPVSGSMTSSRDSAQRQGRGAGSSHRSTEEPFSSFVLISKKYFLSVQGSRCWA